MTVRAMGVDENPRNQWLSTLAARKNYLGYLKKLHSA